ncbi:MAG: hypothetical protein AAGH76_14810 [Pseudomonadota bacterium]
MDEKQQHDDALSRQLREAIDERAESLDGATLSQLNQARQRALDELDRTAGVRIGYLPLAGATAAAVVVAVVVAARVNIGSDVSGEQLLVADAPVDGFELLLAGEDFELIENQEFFDVMEVL